MTFSFACFGCLASLLHRTGVTGFRHTTTNPCCQNSAPRRSKALGRNFLQLNWENFENFHQIFEQKSLLQLTKNAIRGAKHKCLSRGHTKCVQLSFHKSKCKQFHVPTKECSEECKYEKFTFFLCFSHLFLFIFVSGVGREKKQTESSNNGNNFNCTMQMAIFSFSDIYLARDLWNQWLGFNSANCKLISNQKSPPNEKFHVHQYSIVSKCSVFVRNFQLKINTERVKNRKQFQTPMKVKWKFLN